MIVTMGAGVSNARIVGTRPEHARPIIELAWSLKGWPNFRRD